MADDRKEELIRELADARLIAGANRRALGQDAQMGQRVKANLSRFRGVWLVGAGLLGLVIAKLPPRTKKVVVRRGSKAEKELETVGKMGLGLAALKWVFDLSRPILTAWLTRMAKRYMADRYGRRV